MPNNDTRLNAICPYFTMFPLEFPLSLLQRNSCSEDIVLDPFCGRGTVTFASHLLGLRSISIDSNPVAIAITRAKLVTTRPSSIVRAAETILLNHPDPNDIPTGDFWRWAYHPETLNVLCRLREGLLKDCKSQPRRALQAIILGALHGPLGKTYYSYFSNQSPRTFAPKPRYAVNFWRQRRLRPPRVDVMNILETRAHRYYSGSLMSSRGIVISADSRTERAYANLNTIDGVRWVITSPPYYGLCTYLPDQWLRLWFLGGEPTVDYSNGQQISHSNPETFVSDLRSVWRNVSDRCATNARLVIRFGGISSRNVDPRELIRESLRSSGWRISTIMPAGSASDGKRQAYHHCFTGNRAIPEYDVWARIAA